MNFEDLMKGFVVRRVIGAPVPEWMQDAVDLYFELIGKCGMRPWAAQRVIETYID